MSSTDLKPDDNASTKVVDKETLDKEHEDGNLDVSNNTDGSVDPPITPQPVSPEPSHDYRPRGRPQKPLQAVNSWRPEKSRFPKIVSSGQKSLKNNSSSESVGAKIDSKQKNP